MPNTTTPRSVYSFTKIYKQFVNTQSDSPSITITPLWFMMMVKFEICTAIKLDASTNLFAPKKHHSRFTSYNSYRRISFHLTTSRPHSRVRGACFRVSNVFWLGMYMFSCISAFKIIHKHTQTHTQKTSVCVCVCILI